MTLQHSTLNGNRNSRPDQKRRADELRPRFEQLCHLEPRLGELWRDVQAVKDSGGAWFCANEHWYLPGGFRQRLRHLVGFGAELPALRTSAAYDVAYDSLYDLLPDCRACRCIAFEVAVGLRW